MPTVTVRLDDETDARLKRRLAYSGETLSEFVRSAVAHKLAAGLEPETPFDAWTRIGRDVAGNGESDRSVTYKSRLKERLREKHRR